MRKRTSWLILPMLWLATALRFFRLGAQSFWNDEGNSARLAERSVSLIFEGAAADVHPPLYYLLLSAWRHLLGQSEFALRALSAFSGLLLVTGVLALARRLFRQAGRGPALLAALLVAIHPALVYYSQEARMYALLGLWAVLGTLLFLRLLPLLSHHASSALYKVAVGYLIVAVAGLYTHYFFPAVLLVHNLLIAFVLWRGMRRETADRTLPATGNTPHTTDYNPQSSPLHPFLSRWSALMLAAFLLYLPWLPIFLRQTGGRGADPVPITTFLAGAARWLTLGETTAAQGLWVWLPVAAFFLLAIASLFPAQSAENAEDDLALKPGRHAFNPQSPKSNLQSLTFGLHILLPLLLILLLGATRPAYYKFMIIVPPFLALLAARGAWKLWRAPRTAALPRLLLGGVSLLLVAVIVWGNAQSLRNLYFNPTFARADYRGIAARIASEGHPNAGIILNAANQWEVFTYYHRQGAPVYPLPRGQPDAHRIAAELEAIAAQHDRLYVLFWGEDERDPQRLVERWLDANAFKAREQWVGDVRFVTYAVPPQPVRVMETPAGARFGEHVTLEGYTLRGAEDTSGPAKHVQAIPGDILQVTLFWQTAQELDTRYKIFLHLTDERGHLRAQRDAEPVGNLAPTPTWEPRQTIVDNHGLLLPSNLPAGDYRLTVGLYPLDDPAARLPIRWSEEGVTQTGDSYPLATVTVR